jgi:hypothetical protein
MAVSRALRRLLRVLEIEEEQCQLALRSALGGLRHLEQLAAIARTREQAGRKLILHSAYTGELPDRLAGLQQSQSAANQSAELEIKIADAGLLVSDLRSTYLAKRVERRQAELLITETENRDAVIAARRSQQDLDDWYLNRLITRKLDPAPDCDDTEKDLANKFEEKL